MTVDVRSDNHSMALVAPEHARFDIHEDRHLFADEHGRIDEELRHPRYDLPLFTPHIEDKLQQLVGIGNLLDGCHFADANVEFLEIFKGDHGLKRKREILVFQQPEG